MPLKSLDIHEFCGDHNYHETNLFCIQLTPTHISDVGQVQTNIHLIQIQFLIFYYFHKIIIGYKYIHEHFITTHAASGIAIT